MIHGKHEAPGAPEGAAGGWLPLGWARHLSPTGRRQGATPQNRAEARALAGAGVRTAQPPRPREGGSLARRAARARSDPGRESGVRPQGQQ